MATDNIPRTRSQMHPEPGAFSPSGTCDGVCPDGVPLNRYCAACERSTPEAVAHTRRVATGEQPAQPSTILEALERVAKLDGLAQYVSGDRGRLIVIDGPHYLTYYPTPGLAKVISNWEAVNWLTFNLKRHTPADEHCPACKANVPEGEPHQWTEAGLQRLQAAIEEAE